MHIYHTFSIHTYIHAWFTVIAIVYRPPLPDVSLSEGEVALSPGDARWYSTYATKIGRWTSAGAGGTKTHLKSESCIHHTHTYVCTYVMMFSTAELSPVVAAFLDLKSSPESISETSDHSTSIVGSLTSHQFMVLPTVYVYLCYCLF